MAQASLHSEKVLPCQCMQLFCTGSGALLQALCAPNALLRTLALAMAALLDALHWPNFVAEEDSVHMGTEGRQGIPRFNGEPTRLAEYTFRVRPKQLPKPWTLVTSASLKRTPSTT